MTSRNVGATGSAGLMAPSGSTLESWSMTAWRSSSCWGASSSRLNHSVSDRYQAGWSMSSSYGQQEGRHQVIAATGKGGVRYHALAASAEGVSMRVPGLWLAAAADRDGGRDAVARGKGPGHTKK